MTEPADLLEQRRLRDEARLAGDRKKWIRKMRENKLRASGILLAAEDYPGVIDREHDDSNPALRRVLRWLSDERDVPILVLAGKTGVGKTVAAAYALASLGGKAHVSERLSRMAASNYDATGDEFDGIIRHNGLLVVDDAGLESDADKARAMLFELFNARQGIGRTIITTNLSRDAFIEQRLCERTLSRARGAASFFGATGEDMRGKS